KEKNVTICGGEGLVVFMHVTEEAVCVNSKAVFGGRVAIAADKFQTIRESVATRLRLLLSHCHGEWRPTGLVGREVKVFERVVGLDGVFLHCGLGAGG